MEESTKERIREILDNLLNYQEKELDENDIYDLSSIKQELREIKIDIKKKINNLLESGISESDMAVFNLKGNLTRVELALENITYIISESVIVLGTVENKTRNFSDEYEDIEEEKNTSMNNIKSDAIEKIRKRKKIKDPVEAFFVSYDTANKLMKKIKQELNNDNKNE